jgi:uncharacterized protein (DUF736 family)
MAMTSIGTFQATDLGFAGTLHTLSLACDLEFIPGPPTKNTPDYDVMIAGESIQVGAAWKRENEKSGTFMSVVLDDPTFPKPIYARLMRSKLGHHRLIWSR